jgi:hypothetical protein
VAGGPPTTCGVRMSFSRKAASAPAASAEGVVSAPPLQQMLSACDAERHERRASPSLSSPTGSFSKWGGTRRGSCSRLGMVDQMPSLVLMDAGCAPSGASPPSEAPLAPRQAVEAPSSGMTWRETQLLAQLARLTHSPASTLASQAKASDEAPPMGGRVPLPLEAPPSDAPSASEAERTSAGVTSLVSNFHDRFWLPRDAAGDAAAASSACIAALSADAGQRSVAAHLYAVRTTQRLVSQVLHAVHHRAPEVDELRGPEFSSELETAVGAAVHSELCRVFDEVSRVYRLMCERKAALPSSPLTSGTLPPCAASPSKSAAPPLGTSSTSPAPSCSSRRHLAANHHAMQAMGSSPPPHPHRSPRPVGRSPRAPVASSPRAVR